MMERIVRSNYFAAALGPVCIVTLFALLDPIGPTPWNWKNGVFFGVSLAACLCFAWGWVWVCNRPPLCLGCLDRCTRSPEWRDAGTGERVFVCRRCDRFRDRYGR